MRVYRYYKMIRFEIIKFKDLPIPKYREDIYQNLPIGIRRGEFLSITLRNKSIQRTKIYQRTKISYLFDIMYIMDQERGILDSLFRRGGAKDVRIFFIVSERALYDSRFSSKRLTRSHAINSLVNCNNIFWIDPVIYNPDKYITVRRRIMIPSKLIPEFLKSVL